MAVPIQIKRRVAGGAAGAPASLLTGEPAFSEVDSILYLGTSSTNVVAVGGTGAFCTLTSTQTISGAKTFSGTVALGSSASATTPASNDNSTALATTAWVTAKGYLTGNQSISVTGDATGSGTTSIALTLANSGATAGTYTKVTVNAKGLITSATNLAASDIPTLTAAKISDFDTQVRTNRLDQMAAPTNDVSANSQKITNLAAPTAGTDAVNKNYADNLVAGLSWKEEVRVATTANITLSGTQTIDGVSVIAGDRVLVKNQSTGSANGIYVVAAGAWTRATDADTGAEMSGAATFVSEGTTQGGSRWVCSTTGTITIGSTSLTFAQFSGGSTYAAGDGLSESPAGTFNVNVDNSTVEINSDTVRVKDLGITNAKIAASTIDLTAKVTGALPVANGGTALTSAAKGSVLVANTANTFSALDGGGTADKLLLYDFASDTISWVTSLDGGTF